MKKIAIAAAVTAALAAAGSVAAQPAPGQGPPDPKAIVERMDTNKDGAIQKSEAQGRLAERFDMIDANHDGKITPEELAAAFAAMRQQQGG